MRNLFYFIGIVLLMTSCRTVVINNDNQIISDSQPQLGAIGFLESKLELSKKLKNYTFKTMVIPPLENKIRLELHKEKFDKKRYGAYLQASPENFFQISYIDSLPEKPEFISLQLSDRIAYVANIKNTEKLEEYLKNKPRIESVTAVSIVAKPEVLSFFDNAESVFLAYDRKMENYYLALLESNGSSKKIYFNDLIVFAFETSGFCWGANYKHQVELKMMSDGEKCSKGLKKKAAKVNIEKDYLNF